MAEGEHKDERSMMLTMRTDRVMAEALLDDDLFDAALAYVLFVAAEAKRAKSRMIELMDESGREVTIGDVRYYVGHRKSTTITSPTDLLDGLLEATQGDLGKLFDEHIRRGGATSGRQRRCSGMMRWRK